MYGMLFLRWHLIMIVIRFKIPSPLPKNVTCVTNYSEGNIWWYFRKLFAWTLKRQHPRGASSQKQNRHWQVGASHFLWGAARHNFFRRSQRCPIITWYLLMISAALIMTLDFLSRDMDRKHLIKTDEISYFNDVKRNVCPWNTSRISEIQSIGKTKNNKKVLSLLKEIQ